MGNKMTPLEALEIIKHTTDLDRPNELNGYKVELDIIESALKEHETIKQTKFVVADVKINEEDSKKLINQRGFIDNLQPCEIKLLFDEETQKKLKAFEIIKEKEVNIYNFKLFSTYEKWNIYIMHWIDDEISGSPLTQEEYDLLKEVLK